MYGNWKKKFSGPKFLDLFWTCVNACTVAKYEEALNKMKEESIQAYDEFCSRSPRSFCKALLNSFVRSDLTVNNICETFNSYVLNSRDKPIIHLLEDIRKSIMVRLHDIAQMLEKSVDVICPKIRKKLYEIDSQTRYCRLLPAGDGKYEVSHCRRTYIVDLAAKKCSCVDWELSGIPCFHAYACINHSRLDVVGFLDPFYYKKTCVEAYRLHLEPIPGENEWPKENECPIMPPLVSKMPGRPKKKRKRAADELQKKNPNKLTKHGVKMTCSKCGSLGHNKRGCTSLMVIFFFFANLFFLIYFANLFFLVL